MRSSDTVGHIARWVFVSTVRHRCRGSVLSRHGQERRHTKPTQFVKLTLSSDDRLAPRVEVALFDSAGEQISEVEVWAGPVFQGESNVKVIPLNTSSRITEATASCTASIIGYA